MKKIFSIFGKCVLILAAGGVVATLLLTFIFYIPVEPKIAEKVRETLYLEGQRPMANALYNQGGDFVVNFHPAMLDNGTDGIMLNTALAQGDNALVMAMDMNQYPRYWHGYCLILRPLLYVMDYGDLRILNGIVQLVLVFVIVAAILAARKEKRYFWAFLTSYILLTPIALPFSLQYTWVFYIAFGGILFAVRKREFLMQKSRYIYFFLIIGMITVFFDLLTFPLITWGFPLIWWLVVSADLDGRASVKKVIVSGFSWIGGYGGLWFLKWCAATLILGYNVIADGMSEVFFRVGELSDFEKSVFQVYEKWEVLYYNWRYFEYGVYAFIITAWMLWALWHAIFYGWQAKRKSAAFLLIAASTVVWYLTLANHTMIHAFFTHRIFVIGILGFLCFLMECVPYKKELRSRPWKDSLKSAMVWTAAAIVGLCFARWGALEDVVVLNGVDCREVPLQEGEVFQTVFKPSFDNIMRVGFCMKSEDGIGTYRIEVLQDSQILYCMERELSDYLEGTYHEETVYWKLHGEKEYQMQISFHGTQGKNFILMTNDGRMPLHEYGDTSINGILTDGQMLGSFCYHAPIQTKWRFMYAALMCMMFLGAAAFILKAFWTERDFPIKKV